MALRVECPKCSSGDVLRVMRRGLFDEMLRWLDRWPYRCRACRARFHARLRELPKPEPQYREPRDRTAQRPPSADVRVSHDQPTAAVVVRAETREQLDKVLLALARAVSAESGPTVHTHGSREYAESAR